MNKGFRIFFAAVLACLPGAVNAALSGGSFSVPALYSLSGGGAVSGGSFSVSALNLGGPSFSSAAPAGGAFSLASGAAPAVLVVAAARSGLGAAHCYPVPFRPALGHTVITFTALTRSASVRVYTISGELVRSLEKNDSGETLQWDARNSRGERVASGVYIFTVKSGRETADGKLMIIW
jgi:hypothetical protein